VNRPDVALAWCRQGEVLLAATIDRLDDADLEGPSLLPGWSRRQVVAHVARNADALVNLLRWARTGVETPMYASPDARWQGILEASALPPTQLRAEARRSSELLQAEADSLPDGAWAVLVRTAQGRTVPAGDVAWMRCREVWVHAVDVAAGTTFADVPVDVCDALVADVFASWERRGETVDILIESGGRSWGTGAQLLVGDRAAVTAWVTGRSDGAGLGGVLPVLPAWL
jgi:maleylpyruvate isomerase